ncbi:MAG TPA: hypothetical protein PLT87_08535 [Spirochaetales bacterium]|nr:hypothetical protein [Spirochaetales bacterium]
MSQDPDVSFETISSSTDLQPFIGDLSAQEYAVFHQFSFRVFANPQHFGFESADEAAEAFLHYKSRIGTIVRKSIHMEDKADAYLDVCIRFVAKSIKRNKRKRERYDCVFESSQEILGYGVGAILEQPGYETDTEALDFEGDYANPQTDDKCRQFICDIPSEVFFRSMSASAKRLLYLVVKCAWEADDTVIAKAAFSVGVPTIWLHGIVEKARLSTEAARIFKTKLDEKINLVWVDMLLLEARLKASDLRPDERAGLLDRLQRKRHRYEVLLKQKSRCKLSVPNRVVAELLHVPKGSVDSGLYYLRKRATGQDPKISRSRYPVYAPEDIKKRITAPE